MTEYILEAQNVEFKYTGGSFVLRDISVKIERGKKIVFLGGNGAGKTTLFLHFNGILKPYRGKIFFKEKELTYDQKALHDLRKSVGVVFQDPDTQLFSASVEQEVSFGPINIGMPIDKVRRYVNYALEATGTTLLKDKPTQFLSYGEKKKVTIASILSMEPEVIIFDEPTNYLDPKHKIQIMDFLTSLNRSGTTIILSTHDVDIAYTWADKIIVMNEGKIVKEGTQKEIFTDLNLLESSNLMLPSILEYYYELKKQKIIDDNTPMPINKDDLIKLIKNK